MPRRNHVTTPLGLLTAGLTLSLAAPAAGSNALDSPETGVAQVGRGSAWVARADDPLATYFNPAALAFQSSGLHAGAHLIFASHCYDRLDATGQRPAPGRGLQPAPEEVCAETSILPNPQLAVAFRVHQRVGIGLALVAPHAAGSKSWPETLVYEDTYGTVEHASPQRYLMLESDSLALFPTLSLGVAATDELSFGAGFTWGIVSLDFANMAEATSSDRRTDGQQVQPDDYMEDIRAQISGTDGFVPGFVLGVLWTPWRFDIAGWYRWSDAIRTSVDIYSNSVYYKGSGSVNPESTDNPEYITDVEDAGELTMPIPMEARIGVRYRHPRKNAESQDWVSKYRGKVRDPLSQEVFDIELDLTWANNSAVDNVEVRFPSDINIARTPGYVPVVSDQPRHWRDVLGIRLGSDVVVVPDLLSLRAGAFFESKGADDRYLSLDFHMAERGGLSLGGTVRIGPVDIAAAYQHTFFGDLDNGGDGQAHQISGDHTTGQRTRQAINGGSASMSLDEVALGLTWHFQL